jgi:hypothetical protein
LNLWISCPAFFAPSIKAPDSLEVFPFALGLPFSNKIFLPTVFHSMSGSFQILNAPPRDVRNEFIANRLIERKANRDF